MIALIARGALRSRVGLSDGQAALPGIASPDRPSARSLMAPSQGRCRTSGASASRGPGGAAAVR